MATFLVTYDLREGQDYGPLEKKLKEYGTWWHALESVWLIVTDGTHETVRNTIKAVAPKDAKILVIDVSGDGRAWSGFDDKASDWLKNHF